MRLPVQSTYHYLHDDDKESVASSISSIGGSSSSSSERSVRPTKSVLVPSASTESSWSNSWTAQLWLLGLMIGLFGIFVIWFHEYQCDVQTNDDANLAVQYALEQRSRVQDRSVVLS